MEKNNNSISPSYFQVPDVATVTTQMIFQSGLSKDKLTDLGKKMLLAFLAKWAYDNINRIVGYVTSSQLRLNIILLVLRLLCFSKLKLKKDNDIVEVTTGTKIDQTKLQILLDIVDIKKDTSHFVHKICNHWVLVDNRDNEMHLYSSIQLCDKFINEYKLPTLTHDTIITQYKVLTSITSVNIINGNNDTKDVNFSWTNPTRVTKLINSGNDDFFDMLSTFTVKSLKLEDTATQAYVINGPAGVGKTTIVDRINKMNIVNTILKINMMNFVNHPDDFEAIITKIICPFPAKSDNEIWLICFDEIDKWKNLWLLMCAKNYMELNKKCTKEQLSSYIESLNNNFYNTLQRFIDGEILTKVPRLIVMFFTNNGNSLWYNLPPDYEAVKDRFVFFELDYCNYDNVISHLRLMYNKLDEYTDDFEIAFKTVPPAIKISYRKLKQLCVASLYKRDTIVNKLQQYKNIPTITNVDNYQLNLDLLSHDNHHDDYDNDVNNNNKVNDVNNNNKVNDELKHVTVPKQSTTAKQSTVSSTELTKDKKKDGMFIPTSNNSGGIKLLLTNTDNELETFKFIDDSDLDIRRATKLEYEQLKGVLSNSTIEAIKLGIDCNQRIIRVYKYYPSGNLAFKKDVIFDSTLYVLHGEYMSYFDSNQVEEHAYYCRGKKVGKYQSWSKDGKMQKEENRDLEGNLNGRCMSYSTGVTQESNYVNGQRNGLYTCYDTNGRKTSESHYVNDKIHGHCIDYYEDGKPEVIVNYDNGYEHGLYTEYYPNGDKSREATYDRGDKHGTERTWDPEGRETVVEYLYDRKV